MQSQKLVSSLLYKIHRRLQTICEQNSQIGKGSMRAVRLHLTLAAISQVLTAAYLLAALSGNALPGVSLTAALVSIVMLLLSGSCILSTSFYKMLLFTLHNRAWRKLIGQTRDAHTPH
ncbi:hypothetical protein [Enterobacter roggenkampii]|uniref:hypothetical protein n=1 Tax=Enterobacter roggenkampii TaxID=1812935 RepID=UPI0021BC3189|nr:hypothetical protein [Enterobacter roggenkampii]